MVIGLSGCPIQSVIIRVINKIMSMITDQIGLHVVYRLIKTMTTFEKQTNH